MWSTPLRSHPRASGLILQVLPAQPDAPLMKPQGPATDNSIRDAFVPALEAACLHGELELVETLFSHPHARDETDTTEAYIVQYAPTTPSFRFQDGSYAWFQLPSEYPGDIGHLPLVVAARSGREHVVEWFFATERVRIMRATLRLLLPAVVMHVDTRLWLIEEITSCPLLVDMLLSHDIFRDDFSKQAQQRVLTDTVLYSENPEVARVAIAHGMDVDNPKVYRILAEYDRTGVMELLLENGMVIVGSDLLHLAACESSNNTTQLLLTHGVDWGNATSKPLIVSARHVCPDNDSTERLVADGFVDLDARGDSGETALMVAAKFMNWYTDEHDLSLQMVRTLLAHGADVAAEDNRGRTALDYARYGRNREVGRCLVQAGAQGDPHWIDREEMGVVRWVASTDEDDESSEEDESSSDDDE